MSSENNLMSNDTTASAKNPGALIVFSAPSGAGKTTIIKRVISSIDGLVFSVSSTTRAKRKGETDGVEYDFLSREDFLAAVERGGFIEYEEVHGFLYGTRKSRVTSALERGEKLVFDVDVLGALSIKKLYPDALLIYIDVPSTDVLRERLLQRRTEDNAGIEYRLKRYIFERTMVDVFDRIVMNDNLERATREVVDLIQDYLKDERR